MVESANALSASAQAARAIRQASEKTGVSFEYLYQTARRESAFDAEATAPTSSAAGLFQFIEQTWLGAVKTYGARHGLASESAAIRRDTDGKFITDSAQSRRAILDLRFDADKASALAAELAGENKRGLEARLGRAVSGADLYAAHFLGLGGAVKLLSAANDAVASEIFPQAAAANRNVFYEGARPKTVGEVIASFAKSLGEAAPETKAAPQPRTGEFASTAPRAVVTSAVSSFARSGLSPLAIVVLQALDPTQLRHRDDL